MVVQRRLHILLLLALAATVLAVVVTGCGGSDSDSGSDQASTSSTTADDASSATASDDPRIPAAGTYSGTATQIGEPAARYNEEYPLEMTFSSSGGDVRYPALGCEGELTQVGFDGDNALYEEEITAGDCDTGGTWRVLVGDSDELDVAWTLPSATYIKGAVLEP